MPDARLQRTREAYKPASGWASDELEPGVYSVTIDGQDYTITVPVKPSLSRAYDHDFSQRTGDETV